MIFHRWQPGVERIGVEEGACGLAVEENLVLSSVAIVARGGESLAAKRRNGVVVIVFVKRVDSGRVLQPKRVAHRPCVGRIHLHFFLLFRLSAESHHDYQRHDAIFYE